MRDIIHYNSVDDQIGDPVNELAMYTSAESSPDSASRNRKSLVKVSICHAKLWYRCGWSLPFALWTNLHDIVSFPLRRCGHSGSILVSGISPGSSTSARGIWFCGAARRKTSHRPNICPSRLRIFSHRFYRPDTLFVGPGCGFCRRSGQRTGAHLILEYDQTASVYCCLSSISKPTALFCRRRHIHAAYEH